MTKTFVQPGWAMTVTAPTGGTVSGVGCKIGSLFGIAATTKAAGDPVVLDTVGVFEHAKTSAQAWNTGDKIYWDDTAKVMTTSSSGTTYVGVAAGPALNPTATGLVRLNPSMA
jgi:predicted RecA/RadA family phage recombinase